MDMNKTLSVTIEFNVSEELSLSYLVGQLENMLDEHETDVLDDYNIVKVEHE